ILNKLAFSLTPTLNCIGFKSSYQAPSIGTRHPQQARNIVRKVLKCTSANKQLSGTLDMLADADDHKVLVLRDQNDVTSGVVILTAVQNLALSVGARHFAWIELMAQKF
ncbi:hypothetical protein JG687_00015355, partial [Phytophthora cactorum]